MARSYREKFLNLVSPLSGDCNSIQVDIKVPSTLGKFVNMTIYNDLSRREKEMLPVEY